MENGFMACFSKREMQSEWKAIDSISLWDYPKGEILKFLWLVIYYFIDVHLNFFCKLHFFYH